MSTHFISSAFHLSSFIALRIVSSSSLYGVNTELLITSSSSSAILSRSSLVIILTSLHRPRLQNVDHHRHDADDPQQDQVRDPRLQQPIILPLRLPGRCRALLPEYVQFWSVLPYVIHACPPLSRLCGFLYRIFNCYSFLLFQEVDQYFHDLFDIHLHHLSKMYAPLIVRVSSKISPSYWTHILLR